jgi:hypothetical protein
MKQITLELSQENFSAQTKLKERIQELENSLATRPVAALQRLAEMSEKHTRDQRELMDKLDDAFSEKKGLQNQVQMLSQNLADIKSLHAKALKKYDRILMDKEELQHELSKLQEEIRIGGDKNAEPSKENEPQPKIESITVVPMEEKLFSGLTALQQDVREMQQQLKESAQHQTLEQRFLDRFRMDLSNIQVSLNDAIAELTLETEALLESREAIKTVASDASTLMGERDVYSKARFLEQQQQLLAEFSELRDNLTLTAANRNSDNYSCLKELIDDIRRKEAALSAAQTELRFVKEKLQSEIAARQKAEGEIHGYIDQAEAYEEQLMTLQSKNTGLVKKLHVAGLKIDASLNHNMANSEEEVHSAVATPRSLVRASDQREDSLPVLDEALALAENMSNLVRDGGKDGNFLDMLEAMSNLIEAKETPPIRLSPKRSSRTPRTPKTPKVRRSSKNFEEAVSERTLSTAQSSPVSPVKRHRKVVDDVTGSVEIVHEESIDERDDPRSPVGYQRESKLFLVVEQLYARCQMLERERSEMMETTLDLLEATREANAAEIDAVLAEARRRAVEDILEMHKSSKKDQERVLKRIMKNHHKSTT